MTFTHFKATLIELNLNKSTHPISIQILSQKKAVNRLTLNEKVVGLPYFTKPYLINNKLNF